ncbi:hypothetical protein [Streptomyces sp. NPDC003077]|uniref:hypothetical protein n=1 Tax=Streptomyces sp. NPDC003077 TaxID=3154443 RepID=UPI0033BAC536
MRSLLCAAGAAGVLLLPAAAPALAAPASSAAAADDAGFTIEDPRITESSGLAASRAHPGVYWTHNDSDDGPYVYAVDGRTGRTVATITLGGIGAPRDVEAISVGPDGDVYVGDIGDNLGGTWKNVWIYRFREPADLRDQTVRATQYTATYADGPRDAEALMVHPKTGRVYIASKKKTGGALYEGPAHLSPDGGGIVFRKVRDVDLWVTDGAFSPDGTRLVLRGYFGARMYRWSDETARDLGQVDVPLQIQGESVTFTPDGRTLLYGSEGEGSRVQPVEPKGEQLPENAAKDGNAGKDGGATTGPSGAQGKDAGDGDGLRGPALWAVLAAAGAVLVGMAVRKVLRRG